jgi:hypothetical protein
MTNLGSIVFTRNQSDQVTEPLRMEFLNLNDPVYLLTDGHSEFGISKTQIRNHF